MADYEKDNYWEFTLRDNPLTFPLLRGGRGCVIGHMLMCIKKGKRQVQKK